MSLYEVVFDGGDEYEIRSTDHPLSIGDVLEMQGVYWEVVRDCAAEEHPRARYECRRAQGRPKEEIRRRAKETRARLELLQLLIDSTAKPPPVSTAAPREIPQTN